MVLSTAVCLYLSNHSSVCLWGSCTHHCRVDRYPGHQVDSEIREQCDLLQFLWNTRTTKASLESINVCLNICLAQLIDYYISRIDQIQKVYLNKIN